MASAIVFVAPIGAQTPKLPLLPQTEAYERHLLAEDSRSVGGEDTALPYSSPAALATDQAGVIQHAVDPSEQKTVSGLQGIGLTFVDLTASGLAEEHLERLIDQLDAMFAFETIDEDELTGLAFCNDGLLRPRVLLSTETLDLELGGATGELFADFESLVAELDRTVAPQIDLEATIPVIVLDGSPDLLGFASGIPHAGLGDAVVVAGELLRGEVPGRTEGETVGQLIANYIGLKPIWYAGSPHGDMVDDTPCHNGPNFGTFGPTEVHMSMCAGRPRELVENYMDNTAEELRDSWTAGQVARLQMLLTLDVFRAGLVRAPCVPADALVAGRVDVTPDRKTNDGVGLDLRPNPVGAELYLRLTGEAAQRFTGASVVYVTDGSGARVDVVSRSGSPRDYTLDVSALPPGSYYLTATTPDGEVHTRGFYKL